MLIHPPTCFTQIYVHEQTHAPHTRPLTHTHTHARTRTRTICAPSPKHSLQVLSTFIEPRRLCTQQDSSTQGLKATVINGKMEIVHTAAVNYDKDLPKVTKFISSCVFLWRVVQKCACLCVCVCACASGLWRWETCCTIRKCSKLSCVRTNNLRKEGHREVTTWSSTHLHFISSPIHLCTVQDIGRCPCEGR